MSAPEFAQVTGTLILAGAERIWRTAARPRALCDTDFMLPQAADPVSVKVNLTAGTGVDIDWKDGHRSTYSFNWLRDACPCALCDEERSKSGRVVGEGVKLAPGALPMFKPAAKPLKADPVGKYAIKFHWNDGHELGIYSWQFLREHCPCAECSGARRGASQPEEARPHS
jgi:DUF971 family protein